MKLLSIITLLLFSSTVFAQVGTNGQDRKEEGRPVKEYSLVLENNKITLGGVTANGMTS